MIKIEKRQEYVDDEPRDARYFITADDGYLRAILLTEKELNELKNKINNL